MLCSEEPLLEEYTTARAIFGLSMTDGQCINGTVLVLLGLFGLKDSGWTFPLGFLVPFFLRDLDTDKDESIFMRSCAGCFSTHGVWQISTLRWIWLSCMGRPELPLPAMKSSHLSRFYRAFNLHTLGVLRKGWCRPDFRFHWNSLKQLVYQASCLAFVSPLRSFGQERILRSTTWFTNTF